jgi:hypothetical protein
MIMIRIASRIVLLLPTLLSVNTSYAACLFGIGDCSTRTSANIPSDSRIEANEFIDLLFDRANNTLDSMMFRLSDELASISTERGSANTRFGCPY